VRETVRLGLAARGQAKLKVRQPLRAAVVVAAGGERAAIERLQDVVLEELNVKTLRFVEQADELGSYEVKPNYRTLGPRFGKDMPKVADAVAALDPGHVAAALREAVVVAAGREREAIERLQGLVADELNVKSIRYVSEADELGHFEVKPNYRTLGPRFGKQMPQVAAAITSLDPARLRAGGQAGINVDGKDHEIGPDDVLIALQPLDGYQVERSGTHAVALNLELDEELRREALAREVVHAVQAARKNAGLEVEDRIELTLGGDEELLAATRAHEEYVAGETLATSVVYDGADGGASADIEGRRLLISVNRR